MGITYVCGIVGGTWGCGCQRGARGASSKSGGMRCRNSMLALVSMYIYRITVILSSLLPPLIVIRYPEAHGFESTSPFGDQVDRRLWDLLNSKRVALQIRN